jgi:hypothetical protein
MNSSVDCGRGHLGFSVHRYHVRPTDIAWKRDRHIAPEAEQEAIRRGCRNMWTETYAFQARPFYERFGFRIFGRLDAPAPIFPRFFLTKNLDTPVETPSSLPR